MVCTPPWLVGCKFIPSSAIQQLEMWQAETFDTVTIDREVGWGAQIGFNTVRTFLHDRAWEADPNGFEHRLSQFLDIAARQIFRNFCRADKTREWLKEWAISLFATENTEFSDTA